MGSHKDARSSATGERERWMIRAGIGLALVAAVACYIPARRVANIAPEQSLREG